jgi:hypothetical protein
MFDYFGVLVSIILGLALTHLLRGLAKLIQMRHEVKPYWPLVLWTVNVTIFVLSIWWGMFWWKGRAEWTVEWFLFIAGYAVVLFMWASMLHPPEFPAGHDCAEYFFRNRVWFFGFGVAVVRFDIGETVSKEMYHLRAVPREYVGFVPVWLALNVTGLVTKNRTVHAVLAPLMGLVFIAYLFYSSLSRISGGG